MIGDTGLQVRDLSSHMAHSQCQSYACKRQNSNGSGVINMTSFIVLRNSSQETSREPLINCAHHSDGLLSRALRCNCFKGTTIHCKSMPRSRKNMPARMNALN